MKFITLILLSMGFSSQAHDHNSISNNQNSTATYLGNESVMVTSNDTKIVFDPFFHDNYGIYQLVPENILTAMFDNTAPYDNIGFIFISHAHADHFAADVMLKFLKSHPKTKLIASKQAIEQIKAIEGHEFVLSQTTAIDIAYGEPVQTLNIDKLLIEVVRIPHTGWPTKRLDVSNLAFRVTLDDNSTVLHLGDADPNDVHFEPHNAHWQARNTNTAFAPYWFFYSTYGPDILENRINANESVGIHVPMNVPDPLKQTGKPYFSKPGEIRMLPNNIKPTDN